MLLPLGNDLIQNKKQQFFGYFIHFLYSAEKSNIEFLNSWGNFDTTLLSLHSK